MKEAQTLLMLALAATMGCSYYARGPEDYRKATRELLDGQHSSIESCYKQKLSADAQAHGKVVASFEVEAKTGNIVNATIVVEQTTADSDLQQCVLTALGGLKLNPADQRTGQATFEWDFARATL